MPWTTDEWTREQVEKDQDRYYVFGDNTLKRGTAGQACIRGLPNAFGVPTKALPNMGPGAFFEERIIPFHIYAKQIQAAIDLIPTDKPIVVHKRIGKGLSRLDILSPKLYAFMINALEEKIGEPIDD